MRKPALVLLFATAALAARTTDAQQQPALPFQPGERFEFNVRLSRGGASGHAAMWITEGDSIGGVATWMLRFDTKAGVGPIGGSDRTASWIDPVRMASLRYVKREHHILSTRHDSVDINLEGKLWKAADGTTGALPTDAPLDELSFIYFLRTLPFLDDSARTYVRHYDADRNPVTVTVLGRDSIRTKAGEFATIVVEMRVRDPRHYQGDGVIRINLSDDARRLPVRIESRMPKLGSAVLTLTSGAPPPAAAIALHPPLQQRNQ